jgi:hypothetical protein
MKLFLFTLLVAVALGGWYVAQHPNAVSVTFANDPVDEMRKLAASFPSGYSDVSYNVRKTDSLVSPIIGTIDFYDGISYEYVFHWTGGKWRLHQLLARDNGNDLTGWGGGLELMMRDQMRPWLSRVGWEPTAQQQAEAREGKRRVEEYVQKTSGASSSPQFDRFGNRIKQ